MKLNDRAFMTHVNSRIQDRGLVPEHRSMWEWARRICQGPRRAA